MPFEIVVSAEDGQGNVDPDFSGQVTLTTPNGAVDRQCLRRRGDILPVTLLKAGSGIMLQASSGLLNTATNPIQVVAAPATKLVFTTQPLSSVPAGNFFGLVLAAEDANGNIDQNYSGQAVIDLASGPDGATFVPVTVTITGGMANVSGLAIDKATASGAGGYTLQATTASGSPALAAGTTTAITVTPAAATQLVVTTQPAHELDRRIDDHLVISAEDQFGNVDPSFSGPVTLSLFKNSQSTSTPLLGTLTLSAGGGVATFSDLSIDIGRHAATRSWRRPSATWPQRPRRPLPWSPRCPRSF